MHQGKYDTALHLQKLGCKVDPLFPIIKKIGSDGFSSLLEELETDNVNIKELLISKGFAPNLDYLHIDLSESTFNFADFSGISLVYADIDLGNTKASFEKANLDNALVRTSGGIIKNDAVNFAQATLNGTTGVIEEKFYKSLTPEQSLNTNFIAVSEERFFSQYDFIKALDLKNSRGEESHGECQGFVIEYGRYILRNIQKGTSDDLNQKFIDKLHLKLKEPADNSVSRIHTYQNTLQTNYYVERNTALNLESYSKFLESFSSLSDAHLIALYISTPYSGGHVAAIRAILDQASGSVTGYTFFNPDSGVSKPLSAEELYKEILLKLPVLHREESTGNMELSARDLGKQILELGLISKDTASYNKDGKNIHKLVTALVTNDIASIKALSAVQKIDTVGYRALASSDIQINNYNTLKLAIYKSSEEALIALIQSNTKLDLNSKDNILFIIEHLIIADKLSKPVLEALSHKAQELGAVTGKAMIDDAMHLKYTYQKLSPDSNAPNHLKIITDANDTSLLASLAKSCDDSHIPCTLEASVLHVPLDSIILH